MLLSIITCVPTDNPCMTAECQCYACTVVTRVRWSHIHLATISIHLYACGQELEIIYMVVNLFGKVSCDLTTGGHKRIF